MREVVSPAGPWRCACRSCGAHVTTSVGYTIAGNCPYRGSYHVVAPAAIDQLRVGGPQR
jgi:hypothetical protein